MTGKIKAMTAAQFKAWRKRMELSQEKAAALLGVTQNAIYQWEAGRRAVSGPVTRLCKMIEDQRVAA